MSANATNFPFQIDREFQNVIPALSDEEFAQLKENILSEGAIMNPIVVWNGVIVDGHNRYRILSEHPGLRYSTYEKHFYDRYEALDWICKNQLGRRNLSPQQKMYLIGHRYDASKNTNGGDRRSEDAVSVGQSDPLKSAHVTRAKIARETNTSESYVKRSDQYSKGVDAAEEVLPGIKDELLLGKIKPSVKEVAAIAKAPQEERLERAEKLREPKPPAEKPSANKRRCKEYEDIDRIYEELKAPKRVTEDSALGSLRYTAQNMIETCDVLFENFPGLLSEPNYKAQVIEIMQEPKQYILKLEEL